MNLKESLITMFAFYEKEEKTELFKAYYKLLEKHDHETIIKRIEYLTGTSKYFPRPAEILEATRPDENSQMARDWNTFVATRCNNYRMEAIPDFVYTLKELIGEKRCEDCDEIELSTWIKKEFEKYYPMLKKGLIQMKSDPRANCYHQIDGKTIYIDNKTKLERIDPEVRLRLSDEQQKQIESQKLGIAKLY